MNDQQNPSGASPFDTREFWQLLRAYVDSQVASEEDVLPSMIAFSTRDGNIKFSISDPLFVQLRIIQESRLSDRLLVIVCVAYLEDQIRSLLARFLAEDEETNKLLDPEGGPLPLLSVARLAFSSGLIAKEWLEILKEMARLRNKFAHRPQAQSFEDLIKENSKDTWKSLDKLSRLYKQITQEELNGTIHENFSRIFKIMYSLVQFSIDHLADEQPVQEFSAREIISIDYMIGLTRGAIQQHIDRNYTGL